MLFPIGVEEHTVNRVPAISIGIAGLCAVAFLFTWVVPRNPEGFSEESAERAFRFLESHPYLELSEDFSRQFLSNEGLAQLGRLRQQATEEGLVPPDEATLAEEQAQLDQLVAALLAEADASLLRRFALQPSKGFAQPGWLTHMFLHFGWMHLLGNLFFFYLVGPLLEDTWGRLTFSGFYLTGGLAAAYAHYALDPQSATVMAGASGAIAATMGAFTWRYASRQIRMAYFFLLYFRPIRGTFLIPAWLWGGLWFASEVLDFWLDDGSSGVAMMAHIGGFGFGFVIAASLKLSGFEAKVLAPSVEKTFTWQEHPSLAPALALLAESKHAEAGKRLGEVLAVEPNNLEANVAMSRVELATGRLGEASRRLDALLTRLLEEQTNSVPMLLAELGPVLEQARLRPGLCQKLAEAAELGPPEAVALAERLHLKAGEAATELGARSLARAAELRIGRREKDTVAIDYVDRALRVPELPAALVTRLQELRQHAEHLNSLSSAGGLEVPGLTPAAPAAAPVAPMPVLSLAPTGPVHAAAPPAPNASPGPARIIRCSLVALDLEGMDLQSQSGKTRRVRWDEVRAVGVGIVPDEGPTPKKVALTDVVLDWGGNGNGPLVVRLHSAQLGLSRYFPGVPPQEAFVRFVATLLQNPDADGLPDRDALLRGELPRFDAVSAFEQTAYGQKAPALA